MHSGGEGGKGVEKEKGKPYMVGPQPTVSAQFGVALREQRMGVVQILELHAKSVSLSAAMT